MIDVVIPAYKGLGQTRRCLESVLASPATTPREVVVVDDATPDEAIRDYLGSLATGGRITLLANADNAGFVRSANRGMELHPDRDVVLLNSDTEVANDWLERLRSQAHAARDVGTATPFSNNATICSYPFEGWEGGVPGGLGLAPLDAIFAEANARRSVDLPTAVGSCMYIRRDCLAQVGLFDAERFGRGYGEENDFCLRAASAGWRHVLAADVFVFHEGAVSFASDRFELMNAALEALLEVHPEYLVKVRAFIDADAAVDLRAAVDRARIARGADEAAHVLEERAAERSGLKRRLVQLEKWAMERDVHVGELNKGLAKATELVASLEAERAAIISERDRLLAERDTEHARLTAGLANAERLAFERAAELDRIRRSWMWRYLHFLFARQER